MRYDLRMLMRQAPLEGIAMETRQETMDMIARLYECGLIWEARELQDAMVEL